MSLKEQKSNYVIVVSMPPPKADDTVSCYEPIDMLVTHLFTQTWDTGDGDYVAKPYDHYEEVASVSQPDLSAKAQIVRIFVFLLLHFQTLTPMLGYYCNRCQWSSETPPGTVPNRKQRFIPPLSYLQASRWWQGFLLGVDSPSITDLVQFSGMSHLSFPLAVSHYFSGHQVYGKGWGYYLSATKFGPF